MKQKSSWRKSSWVLSIFLFCFCGGFCLFLSWVLSIKSLVFGWFQLKTLLVLFSESLLNLSPVSLRCELAWSPWTMSARGLWPDCFLVLDSPLKFGYWTCTCLWHFSGIHICNYWFFFPRDFSKSVRMRVLKKVSTLPKLGGGSLASLEVNAQNPILQLAQFPFWRIQNLKIYHTLWHQAQFAEKLAEANTWYNCWCSTLPPPSLFPALTCNSLYQVSFIGRMP